VAQDEAARCGREAVAGEHLLAGLLENGDNMAVRVLERIEVSPEALRAALALFVRRRAGGPERKAELSAEAEEAIRLAYEEAARLQDRRLGTEHLLLGLARARESAAGRMLLGMGAELDRLREAVQEMRPAEGGVSALAHAAGDSPPVSLAREAADELWWKRRAL
jgi:ATP-dependent Clp protease ATP-binding subunit ClpC